MVLFLTAATFTDYMSHSYDMTQIDLQYDVVFYAQPEDNEDRAKIMQAVKEQRYADSVSFGQRRMTWAPIPDELAVTLPEDGPLVYDFTDRAGGRQINICINFLDEDTLRDFGEQAGIDITPLLSDELRAIAIQPITLKAAHTFSELRQITQDTAVLELPEEGAQLEIIASTAKRPVFMSGYEENANILYVCLLYTSRCV